MRYVKTRPETARFLNLTDARTRFDDGCYLLWDRDFLTLGASDTFGELIPACGGLVMTAAEIRAEQDGGEPAEPPAITDPRIAPLVDADAPPKPATAEPGSEPSDNVNEGQTSKDN